MGFINSEGQNISYECTDLIEELKSDINEFGGDTVINVWCKNSEGVVLYVKYIFIDDEKPITETELNADEFLKQMTMTSLLILLKKQNEIL